MAVSLFKRLLVLLLLRSSFSRVGWSLRSGSRLQERLEFPPLSIDLNYRKVKIFTAQQHVSPGFWRRLLVITCFLCDDVLVLPSTENNIKSKNQTKLSRLLVTDKVSYFYSLHRERYSPHSNYDPAPSPCLAYLLGRLTVCIRPLISLNRVFENKSFGILTSLVLCSEEFQQSVAVNSVVMFSSALALNRKRCNTSDAPGLPVQVRFCRFSGCCHWLTAVKFQGDQIFLRLSLDAVKNAQRWQEKV